jgi:hypothetical protein
MPDAASPAGGLWRSGDNFPAVSGIENGNTLNLDRAISCVVSVTLLLGVICFPIPTGGNAWLRGDDEKTEAIKSL